MEKMKIVVTLKRSVEDYSGVAVQWVETKLFDIDTTVFDIYLWIKEATHMKNIEDIKYDIQINLA